MGNDTKVKGSSSVTWPLVALAAIGCGFLVAVLLVIPEQDTQSRSAVLGILVTLVASATAWFTRNKVNQVQEGVERVDDKVNGRMTQMIDEIAASRRALDESRRALEVERNLRLDVRREETQR
jgi:hypothetical protein